MTPREAAIIRALRATNASVETFEAVLAALTELGSVRNLPETVGPNTDADAEPAAKPPAPICTAAACDAVTSERDVVTSSPVTGAERTRKWRAKRTASPPSPVTSPPSLELASSDSFLESKKEKQLASRAREVTSKVTAIVRTLKDDAEERVAEVERWLAAYPERYILEKVGQIRRRNPGRKIGSVKYFTSMLAEGTQGDLGLHVAACAGEPAYLTPPPGCQSLEEIRAAYRRGANGPGG